MTNRQNDDRNQVILDTSASHGKHHHHHHSDDDLKAEDLKLQTEAPRVHRDYIETEAANVPPVVIAPTSSHHHHHHHDDGRPQHSGKAKKHRTTKQKVLFVLLIIALVLVGLLLVAGITLVVLYNIGRAEMLPSDDVVLTAPKEILSKPGVTVSDDGHYVTYNGQKYEFNKNRTNILCIGIDKSQKGQANDIGTLGQADTLVLLSIDTETGEIDAIPISRDSITDVALFREDGSYHGIEKTQLCLAYAYGADDVASCENVVTSVSRMFYGIPINTYLCIDLGAIPILNDAVGGVTVNLTDDFINSKGRTLKKGSTITLFGKDAEYFVRMRNTDVLNSNLSRMERQKQYLNSFFTTAMAATKQDLNVPLTLFDKASKHCTTTLNPSRITFLATTLVTNDSKLEFHGTAGDGKGEELVEGDDHYAEFIIDETALYETILKVFYTKVG